MVRMTLIRLEVGAKSQLCTGLRFSIRVCGTGRSAEFLQNQVFLNFYLTQDGYDDDAIAITRDGNYGNIYYNTLSEHPGEPLIQGGVVVTSENETYLTAPWIQIPHVSGPPHLYEPLASYWTSQNNLAMPARLSNLVIKRERRTDELVFSLIQLSALSPPTDRKFFTNHQSVTGLWYRVQPTTEPVSIILITINRVSVYLTYVAGSVHNRS